MGMESTNVNAPTPDSYNNKPEEPLESKIDGVPVKIFPHSNGSYTVYVDTCSFTVEKNGDTLEATNITPSEHQGAWRADSLKPFALKAIFENYFN